MKFGLNLDFIVMVALQNLHALLTDHREILTLDPRIDVGQGINVGLGKFRKNDKLRAFNAMFYVVNNYLNDLYILSNKAVGPGKKIQSQ